MDQQPAEKGINKNLLILHFTVFIWGFTSILGALISISAVQLVWYRVLIASASLFLYFRFGGRQIRVSKAAFIKLFFTGALVGGHWILFFQAIKSSTVPVTLVCLSSMTLFTAFLEPLFKKKKISKLEILAGALIITGILIIFKFETRYTMGIIFGLLSACAASIFSIINSKQVQQIEAPVISLYELLGALFWITIYLLFTHGFNAAMLIGWHDAGYLVLLGTVCTSLAYVSGVSVMREISAFKVALITNLEPVYGIILSFLFFGETNRLTLGFWVGAIIILSTIFLFPVAQTQLEKRRSK
ncbi:threonine/homoserine efflux transporter RhtA [Mucilaginibacter yixingensis]|uniref:Threonine/homoserine efflux transporter RhtA n=1 Tax=Mucilaginibacter yixingensis TaxID=1295612 RepID=A0A2T5JFY3_9SPHI|nr:EamA family transporter [Mucilaginibacter yixingensis]PTR01343.1 threonine/homoserine efflux transporter RhtA [Mucilaginibacter yixingensis]